MKKHIRQNIAWVMAIILLTSVGCQKHERINTESASDISESIPAVQAETVKSEMSSTHGFILESSEENSLLASDITTYHHEKSGATLVCIENDDPELAFTITYRTPYMDETDTNHIFEHSIIASSEKYPSHDLFFDIMNKSYNTFVNAFTYNTFTSYPLSSTSEDQLIKLMDAYLSCMAAPDILKNENIFKREALRYELEDKDSPITMTGTVYSEDFGSLTDIFGETYNNIADALYPGEYASNLLGRAHRNYQNLTYEHTIDLYNKFYHFDNSLILLYGAMDYDRVMEFLDDAWLSQAEMHDTDMTLYWNETSSEGFTDVTCMSPAYEGDQTENASVISYAIDMSSLSWEELVRWEILSSVLNNASSPLGTALQQAGISAPYYMEMDYYALKPYLNFVLYNTNEDQKQEFYQTVRQAIRNISENGIEPMLLESALKAEKIRYSAERDTANAGVNLFAAISNYWTHTGETDIYQLYESTLETFLADAGQEMLRNMAASVMEPDHSALIATVPAPGLAEQIEQEAEQYLEEKKASMTEEELEALIADTVAFRAWNEQSSSNSDFRISPKELPKAEPWTDYVIRKEDGVTLYQADSGTDGLSQFSLYLDTSSISNEDLYDLSLYLMLFTEFDTDHYSYEEIQMLLPEYLNSLTLRLMYPGEEAGENHHPMLRMRWYCMAEDFEDSLDFLMELLENNRMNDPKQMKYILDRDMDSYDWSRTDDPFKLAQQLSLEGAGLMADSWRYANAAQDQGFYRYLQETRRQLDENPAAIDVLSGRMKRIADAVLVKGNVVFSAIAPGNQLCTVCNTVINRITALKQIQTEKSAFRFPAVQKKRGVIAETSTNYSILFGDYWHDPSVKGRYFPFLTMASDQYIIPEIRFRMGAYSSGGSVKVRQGLYQIYTYSDPNVGATIDVMNGTPDYIRQAQPSQEELDGYILSTFGAATAPLGMLTDKSEAIQAVIFGADLQKEADMINDILYAEVSDQQEAADNIEESLKNGMLTTVGTEKAIQADASYFDEVRNLKEK
ncbi:MAG: insulinase family protein [Enterocloster sp.]